MHRDELSFFNIRFVEICHHGDEFAEFLDLRWHMGCRHIMWMCWNDEFCRDMKWVY